MGLFKIASELDSIETQEKNPTSLFGYKTPDENDGNISCRPLFIEIGGPCVHVHICPETRIEHDIIKTAVMTIVEKRKQKMNYQLDQLCIERLKIK